jgi:excisionase family DNA binding protein
MARNEKVARRMLTTEEAAEYLGTTPRHVRRLVSDHELSRYKVGGRNRFADVDLDAWLDARRVDGGRPVSAPAFLRSTRATSARRHDRR